MLTRLPTLLAVGLLAGCAGRLPGPAMPEGLVRAGTSSVRPWVEASQVTSATLIRFRWSYLDEQGTAKGRGSAVLIPPDSLRFDFRGPLGQGSGAAMVVGDRAIWAEPEDEVEKLVPNYPILWAMLGQSRHLPDADWVESVVLGRTTAWRYITGPDTVEYLVSADGDPSLVADVREAGRRVARVFTRLDAQGMPLTSRLDIPGRPARLELSFYGLDVSHAPVPGMWQRPDDAP